VNASVTLAFIDAHVTGEREPMLICNRELLKAPRTYYVRTDGNDNNSGLTNDAAGAFLTIQKAADVVLHTLDVGGFDVTIQIGDGNYTAGATLIGPQVGKGNLIIQGNATTPSNVVVTSTNAHTFQVARDLVVSIRDLEMRTVASGMCLRSINRATVSISNVVFGPAATYHIQVFNAELNPGSYTIAGSTETHMSVGFGAVVYAENRTITLTGTPHFSTAYLYAEMCGVYRATGVTFVGSATGVRHYVIANAAVQTNGAGLNYFPGNQPGQVNSGGQFL
jgi:hypothetical protein